MIQEVARVPKYELTHDVQQCVVLVALPGQKSGKECDLAVSGAQLQLRVPDFEELTVCGSLVAACVLRMYRWMRVCVMREACAYAVVGPRRVRGMRWCRLQPDSVLGGLVVAWWLGAVAVWLFQAVASGGGYGGCQGQVCEGDVVATGHPASDLRARRLGHGDTGSIVPIADARPRRGPQQCGSKRGHGQFHAELASNQWLGLAE
jgi:hypothetical protein